MELDIKNHIPETKHQEPETKIYTPGIRHLKTSSSHHEHTKKNLAPNSKNQVVDAGQIENRPGTMARLLLILHFLAIYTQSFCPLRRSPCPAMHCYVCPP